MSQNIDNSCGGSGCNTPEHEKRLGTDSLHTLSFECLVKLQEKEVQLSHKTNVGDLVEFLERTFGEEWPSVNLVNIQPLITYSIAN